ncbi:hypothetical protein Lxx22630 [Leifsonia xyli subsp. xyli str. CTCB07]|uniref:Uncharacterized protein n=1 Tax=Leifsonia xyli subsp. xyli (strain CTCB07) TaxID=281090 RepID=Q6ACG3_LEIXX|nr:hypothetical protein Lxx22630 [Leifsonia xyli subsp. xyli str. CTCB07]
MDDRADGFEFFQLEVLRLVDENGQSHTFFLRGARKVGDELAEIGLQRPSVGTSAGNVGEVETEVPDPGRIVRGLETHRGLEGLEYPPAGGRPRKIDQAPVESFPERFAQRYRRVPLNAGDDPLAINYLTRNFGEQDRLVNAAEPVQDQRLRVAVGFNILEALLMDPVRNPYSPGAVRRPAALVGRQGA